jgi:DNA-binding CsgD family transcriptional regulator
MEQLRVQDLNAALTFVRDVAAQPDLDAFARRVVDRVTDLVPGHRVSYNEAHVRRGTLRMVIRPVDGIAPLGARHYGEHPMMQHFVRTGDGRARKFSDFMARDALHATAMYQEHYRAAGVEYQMTICLGPPTPYVVAFAVGRDRRDFSERDRLLLNTVRPHLTGAYARAGATARRRTHLQVLTRAADLAASPVVLLGASRAIDYSTPRARQLLREYFPRRGRPSPSQLPDDVADWLARQLALEAGPDLTTPAQPFVTGRGDHRLTIRLAGGPGERALLLEERRAGLSPAALAPLGLTRRESEVLALVAQGASNEAIALTLATSPRTVAKHVERIHRKLGVESRAAAAARAYEVVTVPDVRG